jgi:hypothetical protein
MVGHENHNISTYNIIYISDILVHNRLSYITKDIEKYEL